MDPMGGPEPGTAARVTVRLRPAEGPEPITVSCTMTPPPPIRPRFTGVDRATASRCDCGVGSRGIRGI